MIMIMTVIINTKIAAAADDDDDDNDDDDNNNNNIITTNVSLLSFFSLLSLLPLFVTITYFIMGVINITVIVNSFVQARCSQLIR